MIQKVFGVRDSKALAFLQPFFSSSVGSAVRAFSDAVNDGNPSPIAKHPEDYCLYELGDFDDATGGFVSCNPIKMLGAGSDFMTGKRAGPTADELLKMAGNMRLTEAVENGK